MLINADMHRVADHALEIAEEFTGPDFPPVADWIGGTAWPGWRDWYVALRGKWTLGVEGELSGAESMAEAIKAGDAAIKKYNEQTA